MVTQIDPHKFLIEHRDGTKYPITLNIDEQGKTDFVGLPKDLEYTLATFSDEEKRSNPLLTLQVVIREREGANEPLQAEDLPSEY